MHFISAKPLYVIAKKLTFNSLIYSLDYANNLRAGEIPHHCAFALQCGHCISLKSNGLEMAAGRQRSFTPMH